VAAPPIPFRQFIIKVNSRCNLACRYCYMYEAADQGWRRQPVVAGGRMLRQTARRIGEHAATHALPAVSVVLHGGEPLLTGPDALGAFVRDVRVQVPVGCEVRATVQTNGLPLTEETLRALTAHRIRVGLSLDGGLAHHNRHRLDHAGRPAWPAIRRAARLLAEPRHRAAYAGVLCVVDPATDPAEVYRSLLRLDPPSLHFLLPHGNWTTPPPGIPGGDPARDAGPEARPQARPTPYADWLCAVFDQWWRDDRRRVRVRLFQECLALLLGLPATGESMGLHPFTAAVVETDGGIEQVDSLKTAYPGAAATGLDVFAHPFDAALAHPGVAARHAGLAALAPSCRSCPLVAVCGGGHYAHRYRHGHGFRNPSVYCADLQRLIRHIAAALRAAAVPEGTAA
jgi:uncharacterized protein